MLDIHSANTYCHCRRHVWRDGECLSAICQTYFSWLVQKEMISVLKVPIPFPCLLREPRVLCSIIGDYQRLLQEQAQGWC